MKRILLTAVTGLLVFGCTGLARADEPFNPDCHLREINEKLDALEMHIKTSPAWGAAAGHYGRAMDDLEKVRKQLHEGCRAWNEGLHRH